jgi:predicted N-acyltransferase
MRRTITDSIDHIDRERWDSVAGQDLTLSWRWQRVMEAGRQGYRPRYLLLEDTAGPLAAVVLHPAERFGRRGWADALLSRLMLVAPAPYSARQCGFALRAGVALQAALPDLERALETACWRERRPVLGVANLSRADLPVWLARGYLAWRQPDSMYLDLGGASYPEYLDQLEPKTRSELARMRRRAVERGVTFDLGSLAGHGRQLFELLAEVFARHGITRQAMPFTPGLFDALERELSPEVLLFEARVGGELGAFFLCLRNGDRLLAPFAGLRYALARPNFLYFLLIDELVRWSVAHRARWIFAGRSNDRQKARQGFSAEGRWLGVRTSPRLLSDAIGLVLHHAGGLARRVHPWSQSAP